MPVERLLCRLCKTEFSIEVVKLCQYHRKDTSQLVKLI